MRLDLRQKTYLLIGFWYHKPTANNAAIKAFLVNRVGDFGYALGIAGVFYIFGSIEFSVIFDNAENFKDHTIHFIGLSFSTIDLLCFLLFIGAMGKSAQLGLHTWLPDAMEGPTPVSALILAANMAVEAPIKVINKFVTRAYSNNGLILATKNTPAVTIVAA